MNATNDIPIGAKLSKIRLFEVEKCKEQQLQTFELKYCSLKLYQVISPKEQFLSSCHKSGLERGFADGLTNQLLGKKLSVKSWKMIFQIPPIQNLTIVTINTKNIKCDSYSWVWSWIWIVQKKEKVMFCTSIYRFYITCGNIKVSCWNIMMYKTSCIFHIFSYLFQLNISARPSVHLWCYA